MINLFIDPILIIVLYLIGVAYHILQRIREIRNKYPDLTSKKVWAVYKNEEWDTMLVMGVCLLMIELFWIIAIYKDLPMKPWIRQWGVYPISVACGYFLHRIIYKVLGTTEKVIDKRIDEFAPKP